VDVQRIRLVVKDSLTREGIDTLAKVNQWSFVQEILPGEDTPYQKIWTTADTQTAIHYIEDALIKVRYLQVKGAEPEKVARQIHASGETFDREDMLYMLDHASQPAEAFDAIYFACIVAPEQYDREYFERFEKMFSHADAEVRRAAIFAVAYFPWPQFRAVLERLVSDDAEVSYDAEVMLDSLIDNVWESDEEDDDWE
jgi:hypothetical protein